MRLRNDAEGNHDDVGTKTSVCEFDSYYTPGIKDNIQIFFNIWDDPTSIGAAGCK